MDPDFMTRYLPEHGAARETGHDQPADEPHVDDPSVAEPGAGLDTPQHEHSRIEETTAVLPPDVSAAVRAHTPRPQPAPPQPQTPPRREPAAVDPDGKTTPVAAATRTAEPRTTAPPQRPGPAATTGPAPRPVHAPPPPPRPAASPWDTSAPIPATGAWNPGAAAEHLRPDDLV
jgi:hypothetical protein